MGLRIDLLGLTRSLGSEKLTFALCHARSHLFKEMSSSETKSRFQKKRQNSIAKRFFGPP